MIKTFVVQAFVIPSGSMQDTLDIGDKILVNKLVYHIWPIQPGDVVVFNRVGSWDPARAVAGPGPGLAARIRVALDERSYLSPGNQPDSAPPREPSRFSIRVPGGYLWVLGDHRAISVDSRGHQADPGNGMVPASKVIGRGFVIAWPPSRWRSLPIPATFGQPGIARTGPAAFAEYPGPDQPALPDQKRGIAEAGTFRARCWGGGRIGSA